MTPRRLFCAALPAPGQACDLGPEAAQHAHVLRLAAGDRVTLFDGQGGNLPARLVRCARRELVCQAAGPRVQVSRAHRLVLIQCLPKGGRIDDIVRMTTEIGVAAIHLALAERSVARPERERGPQKAERLRRVAVEAARQSEQDYVPDVEPPASLAEVSSRVPAGAAKVALLARHGHVALPVPPGTEELWLAVGPEGGFSPSDQSVLAAAGFISGGLGHSILRTETAAVVGVALGIDRLTRRT